MGAALGFAVAGPVGSVFGALLGHQVDQGRLVSGTAGAPERTQRLFFEVSFEVMGHLAKSDGRVSDEEIASARRIMHAMQLTPAQMRLAIEHFNAGKAVRFSVHERINELKGKFGARRDLARAFVEIQVRSAVGAGEILELKRQALSQVASSFGVGRRELAQIEALIRAQSGRPDEAAMLEAAYRSLGVERQAGEREVKMAYRRLMNRHHPDKLVAKGLPDSMVSLAEQKTHEIRAAYDRIKTHRGFK